MAAVVKQLSAVAGYLASIRDTASYEDALKLQVHALERMIASSNTKPEEATTIVGERYAFAV
jgi:hypothetical protein